ncbi:DUF1801 domain-containing protein [Joostella atrarenae]|uniref:DUF1801 domain-containing protein n=1 Tax=Joostella atrarenae TaxID=679257 RepID=A0ABS9J5N3_9FLAO|nr:DUF1801 domain-containing protein [Joostella atrarenae]MCF8715735.1 DUF1801 domain-containing protein [Joostella atrarenae]
MENLEVIVDPAVKNVFNKYPASVKNKMLALRELVLDTANSVEAIDKLEETLKWGEPSYVTKIGSTLRMDWKSKSPDQYAMYFQCSSSLVSTFRLLFGNTLTFEGNRAIIFKLEDKIPEEELKCCIKAALTYHKVKHLPTLGI